MIVWHQNWSEVLLRSFFSVQRIIANLHRPEHFIFDQAMLVSQDILFSKGTAGEVSERSVVIGRQLVLDNALQLAYRQLVQYFPEESRSIVLTQERAFLQVLENYKEERKAICWPLQKVDRFDTPAFQNPKKICLRCVF